MQISSRTARIIAFGTAIVVVLILFYTTQPAHEQKLITSEAELLTSTWTSYEQTFIEEDTFRTVDPQRDAITTSEGQSYTMLRAVWMNDKETFDGAMQWTFNNLGRDEDGLFSWLFGERADGTYGIVIENNGQNSAIDADSDIAVALLFAYARWRDDDYLYKAREIIDSIWEVAVVDIQGKPYLTANNVEKTVVKDHVIVNPSYLAPYAYRLFSVVDPDHDWDSLVDNSYELIKKSTELALDADESAGLPPDWILVNRNTGDISAPTSGSLSTDYGYEALRIPWRLALDWHWYRDERAIETLELMNFLSQEWEEKNQLAGTYTHGGEVKQEQEASAMYGGSIGYFYVAEPVLAQEVYEQKLLPLYSHDRKNWASDMSYYDANWVWFGIALQAEMLPNLAQILNSDNIPPQ